GQVGESGSLEEAVRLYTAVLRVRTRAVAPQDWAFASVGLANAHALQAVQAQNQEALRAAIAEYQPILEVYTRDASPSDWANVQTNLGFANQLLGDEQGLRDAVAAYFGALQVQRRDAAPEIWAQTLGNLTGALLIQGWGGDEQALFNVISVVTEVNTVHAREHAYDLWV